MATIFYDKDADLEILEGKTVAIIGFGNQGRAQSLNMRDSGIHVIIGNQKDSYSVQAQKEDFSVMEISRAVRIADIILILLPDELQQEIYEKDIGPYLKNGQTICFSHGYSIRFRLITPPAFLNIILVAPRMIGAVVRENYLSGEGFQSFVAVENDSDGNAWAVTLAIARVMGATRTGALKTTFAEETELDLYSEQTFWPMIIKFILTSYEMLIQRGYQPEAILSELYASGEASRVFQKMADKGLFKQLSLHSQTSQFGLFRSIQNIFGAKQDNKFAKIIDAIRDDSFFREWEEEKKSGYPFFKKTKNEYLSHKINKIEEKIRAK